MGDFVIANMELMRYKGKGGDVVIPDGVRVIGWDALWSASGNRVLRSVIIPEGVRVLKPNCIGRCSVVTLPSTVYDIADNAINKQEIRTVHAPHGLPDLEQFFGAEWLFLAIEDTRNPAFDEAARRWVRRNARMLSLEVVRRGSMVAARKFLSCYRRVSLPILDSMLEEAAASGHGDISAMLMTVKAELYPPDKIARMERNAEQRLWNKTEPSLADWRKIFRIRTKNGEAVITGYKSDDPVVVIPAKIAGYCVVAVGEWAFRYKWHVASLTVEEGIRELGHYAFEGCTALKEVHLPKDIVIHHTTFYRTKIEPKIKEMYGFGF